ncbi:MAG: hypothetical protein ABIW47_05700 [Ginsengibacter sp.]|jgi:anti-sigma-K factor RskA
MSDDLLNILSNSNKDIDNQILMDYLSGKLSAEDKHAIEEEMIESDFINDAVEGLESFEKQTDINEYASQLNKNLRKKLETKKLKRNKRKIKDIPWFYYAIILVLILVIAGFLILKKIMV